VQGGAIAGSLSRRQEAWELAVFLLLIVPSLVLSFAPSAQGTASFPLVAVATILRDLGLLALILLLIARAQQPLAAIGWVRDGAWLEVGLGLLLSIPVFVGTLVLQAVLRALGLSSPQNNAPGTTPSGAVWQVLLAIVLVFVVAVAEETIFRGYLILRFTRVLRSRGWAVVLSSVAFAIGHGYEGNAAVVTIGLTGLVFALVYVWRGKLIAPIVMHLVLDLIALVLVPLLAG
jgi:membrane protease YdiL (CAAX protease family)